MSSTPQSKQMAPSPPRRPGLRSGGPAETVWNIPEPAATPIVNFPETPPALGTPPVPESQHVFANMNFGPKPPAQRPTDPQEKPEQDNRQNEPGSNRLGDPIRPRPKEETAYSLADSDWVGSVAQYVDRGVPFHHGDRWKLGEILQFPHTTPSLNEKANLRDKGVAWTDTTGPIQAKMRPAIIVGRTDRTLIILPIWSSGNRGHHDIESDSVMLIRDAHNRDDDWEDILEVDYVVVDANYRLSKPSVRPFKTYNHSYINLLWVTHIPYNVPIVKTGILTSQSTTRLVKRFNISIALSQMPVEDQMEYRDQEVAKLEPTNDWEIMAAKAKFPLKVTSSGMVVDKDGFQRRASGKEIERHKREMQKSGVNAQAGRGKERPRSRTTPSRSYGNPGSGVGGAASRGWDGVGDNDEEAERAAMWNRPNDELSRGGGPKDAVISGKISKQQR